MTPAIHRLIEQHAARSGDVIAIVNGDRSCSFRALNYAANAAARRLIASGFRRGAHARVTMRRSLELAVTLLAVLKAGGSYAVSAAESPDTADGISFQLTRDVGAEEQHQHLDVSQLVDLCVACSPNLPVVVRPTDIACVLGDSCERAGVMVPHATIAAMRSAAVAREIGWTGEPGAFELWVALTTGATAVVSDAAATIAA